MATTKTKPTGASVQEYIASRASEKQAADCKTLMAMFRKLTGKTPYMWGPSIVGYGSYKYTYDTGHSGEAPLAGFAIRGRELVLYLNCDQEKEKRLLAGLGKHRMTKSCLYIKQLADIDMATLEKLVVHSIAETRQRYG
jgi:hypothetical protein